MGTLGVPLDQIEISSPLEALDDMGKPANFGWARQPLWNYAPPLLRSPVRRINASDRYLIQSPGRIITLQAADSGVMGYVGITIILLQEKTRSTQTYTVPFPLGTMGLPDSSETGQTRVQNKKYLVEFTARENGVRIIRVDIPRYGRHRYLRGELVLTPPPDAESMVTHMPWRKDKNAFVLVRRSPWYTVEGVIQFGAQEFVFSPGKGSGLYEWSRGVRPRQDTHFWAGASGVVCGGSRDGSRFGVTVGYGDADARAGTENAVFCEGKLHKLDQVTFHISPANWMEPWRFTSSDNRLEMVFTPLQQRIERQALLFHSLHRWQLFGSFAGRVILDDGTPLEFSDIFGMAERRKSVN
jgi:hypothetical protein